MHQLSRVPLALILAVAALESSACHHPAPAVAIAPVANDGARLDRARADSMARADSVARAAAAVAARAAANRRDSIDRANARADSVRRAGEAQRAAEASARTQLLAPIHFDYNHAEILSSEQRLLDEKVALLMANRAVRLRIDGNADERGSDEYNLALGMRRAAEVKRYLAQRGIDSIRITIASNGEERPLCTDRDESCWSRNRRDEFAIVAGGERITAVPR